MGEKNNNNTKKEHGEKLQRKEEGVCVWGDIRERWDLVSVCVYFIGRCSVGWK